MPRPKRISRPVQKNISIPEELVARVDLELWSEVEGKVPFGAWQKLLVGLLEAHFAKLDQRRKDQAA